MCLKGVVLPPSLSPVILIFIFKTIFSTVLAQHNMGHPFLSCARKLLGAQCALVLYRQVKSLAAFI